MAENSDVTREKKACEVCGHVRTVQVRRDVRRDYEVNKVKPEQQNKDDIVRRCLVCESYGSHTEKCTHYVEPTVLSTTYHWTKLCEACTLRERSKQLLLQAMRFKKRAEEIEAERRQKSNVTS